MASIINDATAKQLAQCGNTQALAMAMGDLSAYSTDLARQLASNLQQLDDTEAHRLATELQEVASNLHRVALDIEATTD